MHKWILLIALLVAFPGCSLLKGIGSANDAVATLTQKFEEFQVAKAVADKDADLNKDGKIEGVKERMAWMEQIMISLGIIGAGGFSLKKILGLRARNSASDELKANMAKDIDALKSAKP